MYGWQLIIYSPTFYRIYKKKSTEGFQSIPYVVALFSAVLWLFYAFIKTDVIFLITINCFGCFIETIYLVLFLMYATKQARVSIHTHIYLYFENLTCLHADDIGLYILKLLESNDAGLDCEAPSPLQCFRVRCHCLLHLGDSKDYSCSPHDPWMDLPHFLIECLCGSPWCYGNWDWALHRSLFLLLFVTIRYSLEFLWTFWQRQVIRSKSVKYMPFFLSFFLTISAVVWFFYGLLKHDYYVAVRTQRPPPLPLEKIHFR